MPGDTVSRAGRYRKSRRECHLRRKLRPIIAASQSEPMGPVGSLSDIDGPAAPPGHPRNELRRSASMTAAVAPARVPGIAGRQRIIPRRRAVRERAGRRLTGRVAHVRAHRGLVAVAGPGGILASGRPGLIPGQPARGLLIRWGGAAMAAGEAMARRWARGIRRPPPGVLTGPYLGAAPRRPGGRCPWPTPQRSHHPREIGDRQPERAGAGAALPDAENGHARVRVPAQPHAARIAPDVEENLAQPGQGRLPRLVCRVGR